MKNIDTILKKYWGYDSFRPLQREIIESIIAGRDTLALMPTGGGKSITYQVSTMAIEGLCLVITPLISLMKDQVDALRKKNILALAIHSGMSGREIDRVLDNCLYGDYKFLYVSPERLETDIFKARFARMEVAMIAVDEAHCISQWGYDFRPSYLKIAEIRKLAPDVPILAVTATATELVATDIQEKLKFTNPRLFRMSFARENLSYLVRKVEDKRSHIIKVLQAVRGSGIVYCRTRKECEEVCNFINDFGLKSQFYHGGLSYPVRASRQESWLREDVMVMVATNAFGMGIDKPNVRYVIHHDMPDSLEAYYQEAGRAGRDGGEAYGVLLVGKGDSDKAVRRLENEFLSVEQIKEIYNLICNHLQIAIGEGEESSYDFNMYDFCSKFRLYSGTVISAVEILELCGYMSLSDNIDSPTRIKFIVSREELYKVEILRNDLERFISSLLRTYTGLFSQLVSIDESFIARSSGYTVEYIVQSLLQLGRLRVITYIPGRKTPILTLHNERLTQDNLRITPESYTIRKEIAQKRLKGMVEYIETGSECRSLLLQHYFGDMATEKCGKCDYCRDQKRMERGGDKRTVEAIKSYIIKKLMVEPIEIKSLMTGVKCTHSQFAIALKELIKEGTVMQRGDGDLEITDKNRE